MASIEGTLRTFFKTFDRQDFATALRMVDANAEGSDEITKKWIRGKKAFEAYVKRVGPEITEISSRLSNIHTRRIGNVGLATYKMQQSYRLAGKRFNLNFVGSTAFVRRGDAWTVTLIHLTPLAGSR